MKPLNLSARLMSGLQCALLLQGGAYTASPRDTSSSSQAAAQPAGSSTDVFASQPEPPSRFAEALTPLTQGSAGSTPGAAPQYESDRSAAPQSGSTGGIGAAVADKASQLYNSLPGGTQGRGTGQTDAYQQGGSSEQGFDREREPSRGDFPSQVSVCKPSAFCQHTAIVYVLQQLCDAEQHQHLVAK